MVVEHKAAAEEVYCFSFNHPFQNDSTTHAKGKQELEAFMPINNLTDEQREELARRTLLTLAKLWCDQNGVDAEIRIVKKEEPSGT